VAIGLSLSNSGLEDPSRSDIRSSVVAPAAVRVRDGIGGFDREIKA
jgi:hypothetical protein